MTGGLRAAERHAPYAAGVTSPLTLATVGHSTRSIEDFLAILRVHGVTHLVDVRRWPASRRHPQFGGEALATSLDAAGIAYSHEPDFGGYRKPSRDSPNKAWQVATFRGYADHMATPEFAAAVDRMLALARTATGLVAACCAEAVPERCHRRLLADALVARGARVLHLLDARRVREHVPPPFAVIEGERVAYPVEQQGLPLSAT